MKSLFIILLILFCWSTQGTAQQTKKHIGKYEQFYEAENLYSKAQYGAAKQAFSLFINEIGSSEDPFVQRAHYLRGMCALELRNNDAIELFETFNKAYPENIYRFDIFFRIGVQFYEDENYEDCALWLSKIPVKEIKEENKEEYYFKLAYSALENENIDLAYVSFNVAKNGKGPYAKPSLYFFSHLSYVKGANQLALEGFLKLQEDSTFCGIVPYYLAQIYERQGQYDEVIQLGPTVMKCTFVNNEADVNHIIGHANYKLKNYQEAIPYLEYFSKKGKPTREDAYELGYCYYKNGNFDQAIRQLDKVTRYNDSMTQIALYQIGECYKNQNKLLPARSAFERASQLDHLKEIQEDALYNFAVISFNVDINPYNESVRAFETYLQQYPQSKKRKDVYQYLVNVYTNTSNYSDALASIKRLPDLDVQMKKVFQTVAFNQGVDLYIKKRFSQAIDAFREVNTFPIDPEKIALSKYWTADIELRLNKMDNAIASYKSFINSPASNSMPQKADAYYNIGYAYLKKNNLTSAIESFRTYLQFSPNNAEKVLDAHFRIADCYYVREEEGDNLLAIQFYTKTVELQSNQTDKALYYLSKSFGYNGETPKKITTLERLIKEYSASKYMLKAKYDLGWSLMSVKRYEDALTVFKDYLEKYPRSQNVLEVRLAIADIYYKTNDYYLAESSFLNILSEYSSVRDVCATAVNGLIEVYKSQNKLNEAADIADQYACADISGDEKENIFYLPAIETYHNEAYADAIPKFETYLAKFPTGRFAAESYFYLGNSYYRTADTSKAVLNFERFLEKPSSENVDIASLRTANYYYAEENYTKALFYYELLDQIATQPSDILSAKIGISRCGFFTENYSKSAVAAKAVLETAGITPPQRKDAHYAYGISKFQMNDFEEAVTSLEWLVKNTTSAMGAEAKYLLAKINFLNNEYNETLAEIKALLRMKPSYNYWVAKGLLLQAKTEIVLELYFEAENNLKSVIDHYPIQEDGILEEANALWDELMQIKNVENTIEDEPEKRIEIND